MQIDRNSLPLAVSQRKTADTASANTAKRPVFELKEKPSPIKEFKFRDLLNKAAGPILRPGTLNHAHGVWVKLLDATAAAIGVARLE